jgi:hypothetical protein
MKSQPTDKCAKLSTCHNQADPLPIFAGTRVAWGGISRFELALVAIRLIARNTFSSDLFFSVGSKFTGGDSLRPAEYEDCLRR